MPLEELTLRSDHTKWCWVVAPRTRDVVEGCSCGIFAKWGRLAEIQQILCITPYWCFATPSFDQNFIWLGWRACCCDHRWIAGFVVHQKLLGRRICGRGLLPGCKKIHRIILWCLLPNVRSNPIGKKCLQACAAIAWGYDGSIQIREESHFLFGVGHWFRDPAHRARAQAQLQHSIVEPAKPIQEDIPWISDQSRQWLWRQEQHHVRAANSWGFADDFDCDVYSFQIGRHVWWQCAPFFICSQHSRNYSQNTGEDLCSHCWASWGHSGWACTKMGDCKSWRACGFARVMQQTWPSFQHLEWPKCSRRAITHTHGRDLPASFSLSASAWKRFSDFFVEHPGCVMRAGHIQNDVTLPQQTAVVQVSGQGQSKGGEHWFIQDPHSGHEESSIILRISKKAINFTFYDMYFYIKDLSPRETHLFSHAPQELAFRIKRQRHWVRGIECLGFNVNERTLQIEWVAAWSPIEKQYNMHVHELHRIYPGHIIVNVNNHVERVEILDRLNKAAVLTILVSKPCWQGSCFVKLLRWRCARQIADHGWRWAM